MTTYSDIITQIEELKKQAEKKKKEEYNHVIKTIKRQIADYGITAADLGLIKKSSGPREQAKLAVKNARRAKQRKSHPSAGKKINPKSR